jgi:hypothetical protein
MLHGKPRTPFSMIGSSRCFGIAQWRAKILRGSAFSVSRRLCTDCRRLHSRVHSSHAYPPCSHAVRAPREEHRSRRRMLSHHLRVVLVSNRRGSPRWTGFANQRHDASARCSHGVARASHSTGTGPALCVLPAISCIIIPDSTSCFFSHLLTTCMQYLMLLGCLID